MHYVQLLAVAIVTPTYMVSVGPVIIITTIVVLLPNKLCHNMFYNEHIVGVVVVSLVV